MLLFDAQPEPHYWLDDQFDAFATRLIFYCNLTVVLVVGVLVALVYLAIWLKYGNRRGLLTPMLRLLMASAGVWAGVIMIAALTFSKTPRLAALDITHWKALGAIGCFVLVGLSLYEYYTEFKSFRP